MVSRLLLVDHLLRDGVGHHLGYNLALADAAARSGLDAVIIAAREFDGGLADGITSQALFRRDYRADPPPWIARNHRFLNWLERWCDARFAADLRGLPVVTGRDALFAQMIAPRHFLRWVKWLSWVPGEPVLVLHLGYRPERFANPRLREALAKLSRAARRRLIFATDSEKLTRPFSEALGAPVHYLPHVMSYAVAGSEPPRAEPVVYVAGNARREKGFAEVVGAVERTLAAGNPDRLRFVVQCNHPDSVSAGVLSRRPSAGPFLEWIEKPLDDAAYVRRLSEADVVLLPYHTDLYAMRTSGIFCECRVSGKPVVATRGTWAGDRVAHDGGGWLIEERSTEALVAVLRRIPQEIETVAARARDLAPAARCEFDRDTFLKGLLQLCRDAHED